MKLKLDDNGNAIVKDGMPVYVTDDGKEETFDAPGMLFKIKNLTEEKDRHFDKASTLQKEMGDLSKKMKSFEGIDLKKAKDALAVVEKLDGKQMIEAGEFDKLKAQMKEIQDQELDKQKSTYEKQLEELESVRNSQKAVIDDLVITTNFAKSPYFAGDKPHTILTPDLGASLFRSFFKVEGEGANIKPIGYLNGEKIPSRKNVGEPADFEEAISVIIDKHPGKERFLSSPGGGGPGASGNFNREHGAVVISAADAQDTVKYRAARAQAEKAGVPIRIV